MTVEDPTDESPAPPPTEGTGRLLVAGVGIGLLAVAAVVLYGVPAPAAGIGGLGGLAAVLWGRSRPALDAARPARLPPRDRGRRRGRLDVGLKAAVEAIDEPVVVVDTGGVVRWSNREATARLPTLRLGDPLSIGLRVTALRDTVDEVVTLGRTVTVEWQEKVPTERWQRAHVAPLWLPPTTDPDRRPDLVLIRIVDLTESRRVERMRADFVANASHELRTPLAALTGFIETLQGPARDDPRARERFLAVMAEQGGRMKRLIDDLLSLSRVEMRAHLRPEGRIDLAEVLPHVVDLVAPAAAASGVTLALELGEGDRGVRGDRDELIQVFVNLVENAVKYGAAGGRVDITVGGDDARLAVAVRDHGPGIDAVHLPRLTERFYRAHDQGGAKRGTGLGLAIVKHIVTRHGGRLDIASKLGEGSVFTVVLDRAGSR